MGGGASHAVPDKMDRDFTKAYCGDKFDPKAFDSMKAEDGTITREQFFSASSRDLGITVPGAVAPNAGDEPVVVPTTGNMVVPGSVVPGPWPMIPGGSIKLHDCFFLPPQPEAPPIAAQLIDDAAPSDHDGDSVYGQLAFGLAWDVDRVLDEERGILRKVDLDASLVVLSKHLHQVDLVYFRNTQSKDKAILHSGDNLSGDEKGDDEVIMFTLEKLNPKARFLALVVNSYNSQPLDCVRGFSCHLFETSTSRNLARYQLNDMRVCAGKNGFIVAVLVKPEEKGDWVLWTTAQPSDASEVHKSIDELKPLIEAEFPWAASKHRHTHGH